MAAANSTVHVEEVWTLRDEVSSRMQNIERATRRTNEELQSGKSHLSWIERRLASIGVAMGAAYLARATKDWVSGLVDANRQLQQGQFSIASLLFTASRAGTLKDTFVSVGDALARSKDIYRELEISAAKSLGTTQDFLQTWTFIANPVMNAKGNIKDINELTMLTVAAAKIFGDDIGITAMSVNQMLRGQIDARDKLASALRLTSKEINELKTNLPEALKQTISRLREFSTVSAASANTFEAKWTSFLDVVQQVKRAMGEPLFLEIERMLVRWVKYFSENREAVLKWARSIGNDLVSVLKTTISVLETLKTAIGPVIDALTLMASATVITKIIKLATSVGELATAFSNVGKAIKANPAVFAALMIAAGGFALKEFVWDRPNAKKVDDFNKRMQEIATAYTPSAELSAKYAEAKDLFVSLYPKEAEKWHAQLIEVNNAAVRKGGGIPSNAMDPTRSSWYMDQMIKRFMVVDDFYSKINVRFVGPYQDGWKPESERDPAKWIPGTVYFDEENKFKPKDLIQDFRGSHFEIKVDARHQDPDRVAASIINTVGKQGLRRSQARTARPHLTGG